MKLSNSFIKLIFFHYAGLLLFGEATEAKVLLLMKQLGRIFFFAVGNHTQNFKLISRSPNVAGTSRRHEVS